MRALTRYTQYTLAALLLPTLASCGSSGGGGGAATSITPMTFTAVNHSTGDDPRRIAIADLNGDGAHDVVTANYQGESISILLGNGDGTLQPRQDIALGGQIWSAAVGDINGDTIPDIAAAANTPAATDTSSIELLFGTGNGSVVLAPSLEVPDVVATDIAIADFNADTFDDVAVAEANGNLAVFFNRGDGSFLPPQFEYMNLFDWAMAVADFNGDSHLDIVTSSGLHQSITTILGNGDGTFQPSITRDIIYTVMNFDVDAQDINVDGYPDIVIPTESQFSHDIDLVVFMNKGDGTFAPYVPFGLERTAKGVAIGDLNGDTLPDIVTGGRQVSILSGHGTGFFDAEQVVEGETDIWMGLEVADMNDDGLLDIVAANYELNLVTVYLQQ